MSAKWKFVALVECPVCEGGECIYRTSDSSEEQHISLVTGETFLLSANTETAIKHRKVDWNKLMQV